MNLKQHPITNYIPAIIGMLLYLMTINHGFVLDDNLVLTNNVLVTEGVSAIPELLTTNFANGHQGQNFNDGLYRPLSLVTFAIEQSLFSLNPKVSHTLQALLYALLLLGLMLWLRVLLKDKPMLAFWITLLFAVHPIHTEVIANLKGRDDLLAMLFFCFSAFQFTRWLQDAKPIRLGYALLLFFIALFSKESAITFLVIFPLLVWMYAGKSNKLTWLKTSWFLVPVAVFLVIRTLVLLNMGPIDSGVTGILQNVLTTSQSFSERIATAATIQGLYIQKLFLPFNLSHDYSYNAIPLVGLTNPAALLWLLTIVLLVVIAIRGLINRKLWAFGIGFYFITISVVANVFILIGAQAAERFVFAPSLGWCIAIVAVSDQFRLIHKHMNALFIVISIVFIGLTIERIPDWESNFTLFTTDVKRVPQSARAHYNAGTAYNDRAKVEPSKAMVLRQDAIKHLQTAIRIWPDYQDAYNNLGVTYSDAGMHEEALNVYRTLIKRFPNYSKARFNYGYSCYQMKNYADAESAFETYYSVAPNNDVLFLIAECEGYQNKFDEAITNLHKLIELEPRRSRGYLKLGMAHAISGNTSEAERILSLGINNAPSADLYLNLALVYANTGDPLKAREAAKNALGLNPNLERARQLLNQLK